MRRLGGDHQIDCLVLERRLLREIRRRRRHADELRIRSCDTLPSLAITRSKWSRQTDRRLPAAGRAIQRDLAARRERGEIVEQLGRVLGAIARVGVRVAGEMIFEATRLLAAPPRKCVDRRSGFAARRAAAHGRGSALSRAQLGKLALHAIEASPRTTDPKCAAQRERRDIAQSDRTRATCPASLPAAAESLRTASPMRGSASSRGAPVIILAVRVPRELVPLLLVKSGSATPNTVFICCDGIVPGSHRRQPSDITTECEPHRPGRAPARCRSTPHRRTSADASLPSASPSGHRATCRSTTKRSIPQLAAATSTCRRRKCRVIVQPVRVVLRAAATALIGHDHTARRRDVLGASGSKSRPLRVSPCRQSTGALLASPS